MSRAPNAFVSYSHDDEEHKGWVLRLAQALRASGIDAVLDQWDLRPGQDLVRFMEKGIAESDRVVLVCSANYVERANARLGGAGYEGLIITGELVGNVDTKKFIPVIRNNPGRTVPSYLGPRYYVDFRDDALYDTRLGELVREIHEVPAFEKPPLGPNPFASAATPPSPMSLDARNELSPGQPAKSVFTDPWFGEQQARARAGLARTGLNASMELRFALRTPLEKRHNELLDAAYKAQIHTFGWPVGVILGNREEFRPKPTRDGIIAEIPIEDRSSYDYWALRRSGDYFLLSSLFEDSRRANSIFFNTRVVRVTEALMYCDRLYRNLGLGDDSVVGIQVSHSGLRGRVLTTSNPMRHVEPETTQEDECTAELTLQLKNIREGLIDNVIKIVEPLFTLFNFSEFTRGVYEGLVNDFVTGKVS